MEKKVMNTRLAVAAVVLLFGLLLAGQEAAAAGYAAATEATPATEAAPATATDAAEATPATPSEGMARASYGKASKAECEVPGTCDVKLAAADSTRPGAEANPYTRGCSKITGCRG
jgi:hypothetical protein